MLLADRFILYMGFPGIFVRRARSLMDKILASEAEDYRFDSCRAHQLKKGRMAFFCWKNFQKM